MEIGQEKLLEHSGQANHKLVDESETLRAEENGSCNNWMVDMPKMLEQADPSVEMARWKQRSIYRVPEFIKKMTNSDAYRPQFVSLGPYHHGEPHLLAMEEHKRRAVVHLVKRAGKPHVEFVEAIEEVVDELQAAYDDLDDKWRGANIGSFVEMMVTDGCFLLELMMIIVSFLRKDEIVDDYAADDPIFSKRSFLILWSTMRKDMIAMENQLPLVVLQRLLAVQRGTSPEAREINYMVGHLLLEGGECFEERHMDKLGLHFLDIYHKNYCGVRPCWEGSDYYEIRAPCAVEMSEAGIQFKKSNTNSIHDVDFEDGVLSMPLFDFHDDKETILLNLMAFEWLHPDAKEDVVAYVTFMDKIIESERDVALLESEGIVVDITGSKKMVAMFNSLTRLGRANVGNRLGHVQWKMKAYCRKRRNRWRASFVNTYLSNPWVFISLVAAVILLVATLLQTVYTIVPFYTKG